MIAFLPSSRSLRGRLANLATSTAPVGYPSNPALVDGDLVARLQSLAIASSITTEAKSGRLRRRVAALIGAVGVFGWAGAAAAGASVGLATTGNLPAPVQDVVADVLEVVNIEVPRPVRSIEINGRGDDSADVSGDVAGDVTTGAGDPGQNDPSGAVPVDAQSTDENQSPATSSAPSTPGSTVAPTTTTTEPASGAVISITIPSVGTSTTSTTAPESADNGNDERNIPTVDIPINILPINVCDGPAASRNPNCATTTTSPQSDNSDDQWNNGDDDEDELDSPGQACDGPASTRNPNCSSTTTTTPRWNDDDDDDDDDDDRDWPGTSCDGPAASRNPNCASTTTTTTTTMPSNPFERLIPRVPGEDADDDDDDDDDDERGNSGNSDNNRGGNGNGRWSQVESTDRAARDDDDDD